MTSMISMIAMGLTPGGGQGGGMGVFMPMIVMIGIFYFMMIRPQQRKEKERRQMIDDLKKGQKVMFSGGIIGTVANVKDQTFTVKVGDNTKMEIARGAVNKVITKGESIEDDASTRK